MPTDELKGELRKFIRFAQDLRGDEKSEAQSFLEHFFRALGHAGVIEAGATFEFRIAKKPGSAQLELIQGNGAAKGKGGKKFADLLWPDRVLVEMKTRGEKLERSYDQLFDYWSHIVPKRPPYAILCNFDEFWIYDFNAQLFDPVDRVALANVADSWRAFAFLLPQKLEPKFDNNRVEVTRRAADLMARVFRELISRGEARERAQRFILQLLVAMVAEDIGLLPSEIVTDILFDCSEKGGNSYDLFGGLFRQMASVEPARAGRFQNVEYFNGGLFEVVDAIELKRTELYALHEAAYHNDWTNVRPEIFGTLFQDSMDKEERHAYGAHFTSEFDIRKVVGPTIVRPWRERIDAAGKNVGELRRVLAQIRAFRVLDPACGSGNFLFIAYREIKRLERDILLRLREVSKRVPLESAISLHQFYGIDVIPFAVELAKVTLMLAKELELLEARKLADADQLLIEEKPLPLDNLDRNIMCADALFIEWPQVDVIIGNPPYLGAKLMKPVFGADYVDKVRRAYPDVPGRADYCVFWFRRAHDELPNGGRAGLVGTQNIRNNYSRIGGLDYIVNSGGTITDAVSAQVWSGEAKVHVSIVNWTKEGETKGPYHLSIQRGDLVDSPWDTFELPRINSALSATEDVTEAKTLRANEEPPRVFTGQYPRHEGFMISDYEAKQMIERSPRNKEVLWPFLVGREFLVGDVLDRWVIDFQTRNLFEARTYTLPFAHVESQVLPHVEALAAREREKTGKEIGQDQGWLKKWWLHFRPRAELIEEISKLPRYIVCSRVTKRPIFVFLSPEIRPGDALSCFTFSDDYSFGILQSDMHWRWFVATCSKLKGDFRYTPESVFNTFPWPQEPSRGKIQAVAKAAVAVRTVRAEAAANLNYSLRDLYRTREKPGENPLEKAHAQLDAAVRAIYGMNAEGDPLRFLLELNNSCAAKEKEGANVTRPGLSLSPNEVGEFITEDCIKPPALSLFRPERR